MIDCLQADTATSKVMHHVDLCKLALGQMLATGIRSEDAFTYVKLVASYTL